MQLNEIFHLVAEAKESEGLRELAARSGLPESQIIVIAVNRMVHDVFRAGSGGDRLMSEMIKSHPIDYPTDEDLANWESRGLIERRPKEKSQQLADFFKKHGIDR